MMIIAAAPITLFFIRSRCHSSPELDRRAGRLIVASAIDNMGKGAAGQAIQNMNLALGLAETAGLMALPPAF